MESLKDVVDRLDEVKETMTDSQYLSIMGTLSNIWKANKPKTPEPVPYEPMHEPTNEELVVRWFGAEFLESYRDFIQANPSVSYTISDRDEDEIIHGTMIDNDNYSLNDFYDIEIPSWMQDWVRSVPGNYVDLYRNFGEIPRRAEISLRYGYNTMLDNSVLDEIRHDFIIPDYEGSQSITIYPLEGSYFDVYEPHKKEVAGVKPKPPLINAVKYRQYGIIRILCRYFDKYNSLSIKYYLNP